LRLLAGERLFSEIHNLWSVSRSTVRRWHASGDYSITDLAELFSVARSMVYRSLRAAALSAT
jgi:predicted DNA-binding protein YlxM (UPF0122 family)